MDDDDDTDSKEGMSTHTLFILLLWMSMVVIGGHLASRLGSLQDELEATNHHLNRIANAIER